MAQRNEDRDRQEHDREPNRAEGDRDGGYYGPYEGGGNDRTPDRQEDRQHYPHRDAGYYNQRIDRAADEHYDYSSGGRARNWNRGGDDWGGWARGRR